MQTKSARSQKKQRIQLNMKFTSLQTNIVPKTTCNPSKKLSPTIITCAPPIVHPSLGDIAFIHGVATGIGG